MRLKIHENQSRINSTGDEKFELNDVRFEDEGVITCRAENVFGVQETEVELTVLGNFLFYFILFFYAECVIQPSDVHANSYRHRGTREGEGVGVDGTPPQSF